MLHWPALWLARGEKGLGRDYSGVIIGVGEDCRGWSEGDEVFGLCFRMVSVSESQEISLSYPEDKPRRFMGFSNI